MKVKFIFLFMSLVCIRAIAQQKNFIDQSYVEITSKVDSLVLPDKIYIAITLSEKDIKSKKSTEELERIMESTLKSLKIDTDKNLFLSDYSSNYKSSFLGGQKILKEKNYGLIVKDAYVAGQVLANLAVNGISNVNIEKAEYSKSDQLLTDLKGLAVKKSKVDAQKMANAVGQTIGKAIFISDINTSYYSDYLPSRALMKQNIESSLDEPIKTDFEKIKFQVKVDVKYLLE